MLTIFLSPKGGSGTTTVAAAHALANADTHGRAVLIDMCGDAPAALGMVESDGPGLNDWLAESQSAGPDDLIALGHATGGLLVVHRGTRFVSGAPRWQALIAALAQWDHPVVIDAGTHYIPDELRAAADNVLLVTRQCYLALRRATSMPAPTGVVVVKEDSRALTVKDVENVLGVPVVVTIPVDPSIARAIDAGVLPQRHAELFSRHIAPVT